jgi:hypothetical protein
MFTPTAMRNDVGSGWTKWIDGRGTAYGAMTMTRIDRKSEADRPRRRRRWLLLVPLLLLLVWWLWPDGRLAKARELQNELFSEASRSLSPEDRRTKFEALRTVTRAMSDSQRRELAGDMMRRREEDLKRYAQMTPAEKRDRLDRDINRGEQRRQQQAGRPGGGGAGGPPGGPRAWSGGLGGRPKTPEDREHRRQRRLDHTTPELRELTDQYRHDLAARRQERGLPPLPTRPPR